MCKRCSLFAASAVYSNCPTSGPDLHDAGRIILGMAASHSIPWVGSCQNPRVSTSRVAASPSAAALRIVAEARVTDHLPTQSYIGGMKQRRYNRYHEPRRYAAARSRHSRRSSSVGGYIVAALLIGVTVGTAWSVTTPEGQQAFMANARDVAVSTGVMRERAPEAGDYWRGCDDARAAGTAPIYRGEPGYRDGMDGDNDGIACEPYR